VTAIPLSPPQKDIAYVEDTRKPTVYLWNWLTLLYQLVNRPSGLSVVTGTFTATLTGFTGVQPTGPISYTILGNTTTGGICTLSASSVGISGTSNATTMSMTGIPAICTPTSAVPQNFCIVLNNSNIMLATCILINAGGGQLTFNVFKTTTGANPQPLSYSFGSFTNSGAKGIDQGWTITYPLT
jgi:hypothetical protein